MVTVVLVCFVSDVALEGKHATIETIVCLWATDSLHFPKSAVRFVLPPAGDSAGDRACVVLAC